jgi:prepilin-type N-terminal cleavage/methylation domain-containing protein
MKQYNNVTIKQFNKGFTLIEILLAAFIFTAVITSSVAIFTMTLNVQSSTKESRELVQEERLALEQISRDIRISNGAFEFCSDQNCTAAQNPPSNFLKVKSINDQGQTEERIYYVDSSVGTLGYKIVGSETGWQPLFSERYQVTQMGNNLGFFTGVSPKQLLESVQQPYVTISFTVSNADNVKKESEKITQSVTTSVTARSYNQIGQWYQNPSN